MRDFLLTQALDGSPFLRELSQSDYLLKYEESVNPDALTTQWLKNESSYIWKIATLAFIDSNKRDWVTVLIGQQRDDKTMPTLIGNFSFEQGENDDIARTLGRVFTLLGQSDVVFS